MSTLGEILAGLHDRSDIFSLLAEAGDITAIAGINAVAEASGQDPCELALDAVDVFTEKANDEAWIKLIGCIQNAVSSSSACLSEIISCSLAR